MDRINGALRRVPVWVVYAVGVLPGLWLLTGAVLGWAGADPVKALERGLGTYALQFLIASLAVTPLRRAGLNALRFRRALGLLAFGYVVVHLLVWIVLDMGLRWDEVARDLVRRWYIIVGMLGLAAMIPLALTSTDRAIRRMGRSWSRLHRLAYVAGAAAAVHQVMVAKVWALDAVLYLAIMAVLLGLRLVWALRRSPPSRVFRPTH